VISYQSSVISDQLSMMVFNLAMALMLVCTPLVAVAQEKSAASADIPEQEISALNEELAQGLNGTSSVDVRRAYKSVIRKAKALLETAGEAPNRYEALAVMFNAQKRVFALEVTEDNRNAIFATCEKLAKAPDGYAELRLEADMLLSERSLALKDATVAQREQALEEMLARYHGTPAEWKSLVMGSLVATKLMSFDLDQKIKDTMFERFAGDHKVVEFRRKTNPGETDAVFSGTYKSAGGDAFTFPYDLMGHQYVLYFWSQATPKIEEYLGSVKALQDKYEGRFEVFSLNVDELPDAGQELLRKMGLNWTALHLPGGRQNSAFRAYAERDPNAVFVNGQGHVLLVSPSEKLGITAVHGIQQGSLGGWNLPGIGEALDDERYLSQLRSLFIGDFLATGVGGPGISPDLAGELKSIQSCFTPPPLRYRLTRKQELDNYIKAEKLCSDTITKYSKSPGLWAVRNCRIISLTGMWNLARKPKHLEEAVKEAQTVLATDLPAGADVAARVCIARDALRNRGADPEVLLSALIKDAGGSAAPASAFAAAAILAVEANARTRHGQYRRKLLAMNETQHPNLWQVYAFLRDRHHRYRSFWASPGGHGFGRVQKYKFRDAVAGHDNPDDRNRRSEFILKKADGGEFKVPAFAAGEMLGVIFVEPPEDLRALSNLVDRVNDFGRCYTKKGVKAVVAFLPGDTNAVRVMTGGLNAELKAGILPDGARNPLVQQLGILSADRIPNPLLFRPDGTLAWMISGLEYTAYEKRGAEAISLAIASNIEKVRSDVAFDCLEKGDFTKALAAFQGYVSPGIENNDWWNADRLQGRALAYMGLKDWNSALGEIDKAIEKRKDDFKSSICKCHGLVEMFLTKAAILDKLGRDREAKIERSRAGEEQLPHSKLPPEIAWAGVPLGVYYDTLKRLRLKFDKDAK
jgi:tetratricopeptide (TPR) repeat protein